jgi:hypothetical protein
MKIAKVLNKLITVALVLVFLISSYFGAANHSTAQTIIAFIVCVISALLINYSVGGAKSGIFVETNSDLIAAEESIFKLISVAGESVKIFSGRLRKDVYSEKVITAIDKAVCRGVEVQILLGEPTAKLENQTIVGLVKDGKIQVNQAKERLGPHFIVVDDYHVRLEEIHPILSSTRRAQIRYCVPGLANYYANKFWSLVNNKSSKLSIA